MKFLVDQLERNEFAKDFVQTWNNKIISIIDSQPAIQKFGLKGRIQDTMLEMSPVRQAKREVEAKKARARMMQGGKIAAPSRGFTIEMDNVDVHDSFDKRLPEGTKPQRFRANISKDTFSKFNKESLERKQGAEQQKHDRMKKYGRWLMYSGLENLPKDQKRIYHLKRESNNASPTKDAEAALLGSAKRDSALSLVKAGPIEELGNEGSREEELALNQNTMKSV